MRILICAHEFGGGLGIGNVAKYVADCLKQRGHTCIVCSPSGPDISLGSRTLIEKLGGLGILYFWFRVQRFFARATVPYDVVWLHNPVFLGLSRFSQAVVTMHSTYYGFDKILYKKIPRYLRKLYYKIMALIERFSLKNLSVGGKVIFTTVGETTIGELRQLGIDGVFYIPNGVDTKRFREIVKKDLVRSKLGVPKEATIFLSLGRLTYQKMPLITMDIFAALRARNSSSILLVIGEGELQGVIEDYIRRKKIGGVKLLGFVPQTELPQLIACADYYLTSTGYESGQPPLAMLEAMACGLPPIVPVLLAHTISKAKCGLAFNSVHDVLDYVNTVNYEQQSHLARRFAEEHDWSVIGDKYYSIFLKLRNA